jgi:hypothetical protein
MLKIVALILLLTALSATSTPTTDLNAALEGIRQNRSLMGIQL